MTSLPVFRSPYDRRVALVADVIQAHSTMDGPAAAELAVHVLGALNSIPEKVR